MLSDHQSLLTVQRQLPRSNMNFFHAISILLISIPLAINASGSSYSNKVFKSVLHIIAADNCPDAEQCPNRLYNTTIKMLQKNVMVVNTDFVIKKRVYNPKAVAEFFKCQDRDALNCENFIRVPLNKICEFFNAEGQFWTPLFRAFKPRFPCPNFLPGNYRLVNGTLDLNELLKVIKNLRQTDLYDFYWKQTLDFYYKSERTTCIYYIMKLNKVRA